ncbi:MAG: O-antigen ligase family protein [Bacteroidales bacterium]|nr:O-antigen ligase family protein [Bacteroidales bacterium]
MKLLLFLYLLLVVYLPAFGAVDSNGPKFLALAVLNLLTFTWLAWNQRSHRQHRTGKSFFRTGIGIIYTLFLAVILLSFFNAVNLPAAVICFTRSLSVFLAVYLFFTILQINRNGIIPVVIILTLLELVDAVTVFYGIGRFIGGSVESVYDIQSGYTNKNILAAAIFLKMAAPVWLIYFSRGWKRVLGTVAVFCGMLAIFFLSSRAFYLAMALLAVLLALYALVRYKRAGERAPFWHFLRYTGLLLSALAIYTVIQRYGYPKEKDTYNYNQTVVARVTEIKTEVAKTNQPAGIRLSSWQRTLNLIRQSPVTGIGAGNWKVAVLQYENQERVDFRYLLYNHNDFAEITAETGFLGGALFVLLFALVFYRFTRAAFTITGPGRGEEAPPHSPDEVSGSLQNIPLMAEGLNGTSCRPDGESVALQNGPERLQLLFFAATGMLGYAVDAFFNYPADRPEIQVLFALFLATAALAGGKGFRVSGFRFQVSGFQGTELVEVPGDSGSQSFRALSLSKCPAFQSSKAHSSRIKAQSLKIKAQRSRFGLLVDRWIVDGVTMMVLLFSVIVFWLNFRSLRIEELVRQDDADQWMALPSGFVIEGFSCIPNLTSISEPVGVVKGRYLVRDTRYREAVSVLLKDRSSQWDSRREYWLSKAYAGMGKADSAAYWLDQAKRLKPLATSYKRP